MNRQKRTQELFREVNERIHCIVGPEAREAGEHVEYLCECGSLDCMETVKLATYQYEAVRACAGLARSRSCPPARSHGSRPCPRSGVRRPREHPERKC